MLQDLVWVPPSTLQGRQISGTNHMKRKAPSKALNLVVLSSLRDTLAQRVKADTREMEVPSLNIHPSRPGPISLVNDSYCAGPSLLSSNLILDNCNQDSQVHVSLPNVVTHIVFCRFKRTPTVLQKIMYEADCRTF